MASFSDVYNLIKNLLNAAKKIRNQEVIDMAMDLQENFFELRENNEELKEEIKELKEKVLLLESATAKEEELEYSDRGFITLKNQKYKIPYCACCWKKEHKLLPLLQSPTWYLYTCGNCKSAITVMDKKNRQLNWNNDEENV